MDTEEQPEKFVLCSYPSLLASVTHLNATAASNDPTFPYGFPSSLGLHFDTTPPSPVKSRRLFGCWRRPKTTYEPAVTLVRAASCCRFPASTVYRRCLCLHSRQ